MQDMVAEFLKDFGELMKVDPVSGFRVWGRMEHIVREGAYPRLIVKTDEDGAQVLVSPYSGRVVGEDLASLDVSWRTTGLQESQVDFAARVVTFDYQSAADYDEMVYLDMTVGHGVPVRLPEGWTEL